jgi:hypothetical protein
MAALLPCQLQVVEVDCTLYDDVTVIKALTLQAAAASLHDEGRNVQPSARYLRLLQAGRSDSARLIVSGLVCLQVVKLLL